MKSFQDLVLQNRRFAGKGFNSQGYVTRFSFTDVTPAAVPLPAGAWLMLSALLGLGTRYRRRSAR